MSALAGPAAAILYEAGHLRVFPDYHLGDAWFVAAVAAVGVGVAVVAIFRGGAKVAGTVSLITNATVLALYSFIAAFFTLGGSR